MPERDDAGPVTLGEVYRAVEALRRELRQFVSNDRYVAEQKAQDDRMGEIAKDIGELQEGRKWNLRFAISALVVGFVMPALVMLVALYVTGGAR